MQFLEELQGLVDRSQSALGLEQTEVGGPHPALETLPLEFETRLRELALQLREPNALLDPGQLRKGLDDRGDHPGREGAGVGPDDGILRRHRSNPGEAAEDALFEGEVEVGQ